MNGRISVAPSEQLTPTTSGRACSTEIQNASTVWPERFLPLRSIAVKEIQSGSSGATSCAATSAALAFRVSKTVSIMSRSTPPSRKSRDLLRVGIAHSLERRRAVCGLVDARRKGERDVQRPDRARDEARPLGCPRAPLVGDAPGEASALEAHLGCRILEPVVGLTDACGRERVRRGDVRVRGEVLVVDTGDDLRVREVQEVWVPAQVARVVSEALTAVLRLGELLAMDEHAPGAVEHEDALGEELSEPLRGIHESTSASAARGRSRASPGERHRSRSSPEHA